MVTLSSMFPFVRIKISQSYNPDVAVTTPVWAISFSLATTREIDVSFSSSYYLDVSVPCVSLQLGWMTFLQNAGLSHSEIFGSKVICTYPKLIAAYHVLHRLREPRHPPCALIYFLLSPGSSPFLKKDLNQMVRYILLALTKFTFFVHHVKDRMITFSNLRCQRINGGE